MRHDPFLRELTLLLLLTENRHLTVDDICRRTGISRRTFYYYIRTFRDIGFIVVNDSPYYSIDRDSPWLSRLFRTIHFTDDEAATMRRLVDSVSDSSLQVRHLKEKLSTLYNLDILNPPELCEKAAENIAALYDAVRMERQVILKNYSSAHSDTVKDRRVEPFLFLDNNNEIRCYELDSGMNKTFKIARVGSVEILDSQWENKEKHRRMFTDIFHFTGEERMPVKLRLGRLSRNILVEEYPEALEYIHTEEGDRPSHWLLEADVASYVGITRFALGLWENIEILGPASFQRYFYERVRLLSKRFGL